MLRFFRNTFCGSAFVAACALSVGAFAQDPPETYKDLWTRGEYQRALVMLEEKIADGGNFVQLSRVNDKAQLLFETGRIDEAIKMMEHVVDRNPQSPPTLKLALMYKYRGRIDEYDAALQRAARQLQSSRYSYSEDYLLAFGRLRELVLGENPKTTLSAFYGALIEQRPDFVGAYVAAGNLSYRHSGYAIAAKYFGQALEREPDNQEALAGLAECYWKSHDERLLETLQRLTDLNPNHPRARAIHVEQLLEAKETEPALELIGEALAINPRSLRFLSLRSAAHFLDDDEDAMLDTQLEVLKFNPTFSEVFRTTGRLASRHYRFEEGAALQERALITDPNDHQARAEYTLDLMRLGREQEGREELEKAAAADPYNVHLFNLLNLMDTLETFTTVERGSIVLRIPDAEAPVLAEEMLDLLNGALKHYEERYAVDLEVPILVELFDNHDDFMVRSVGLPGNVGHLGICFGKLVTMDAPSVRPKGSSNWQSVLWHEFVHVITLQKTKNRMPRWLSEGISVYEEAQHSPAWRSKLDPSFRPIVLSEGLPSVEDLAANFTRPKSGAHLMFGYFAAGEFVQFYTEAYGFDALVDALDRIRDKSDAVTALVDAAETEIAALDSAFAQYLKKRTAPYENLPAVDPSQQADESEVYKIFPGLRLGSDEAEAGKSPFVDAMRLAAESIRDEDWDTAIKALEEAHELFPDYTGSDAPLRQLAQLYERQGDQEALRETLLRQVQWTPTELAASRKLVEMFGETKDWAAQVDAARIVLAIDPYDVAIRGALVEGLVATNELRAAISALDVLAHLDSGRVTEHRLQRVKILMAADDWDEAKVHVINLLEKLPHYWEAQRLLLEIAERAETVEVHGLDTPLNEVTL